MRVFVDPCGEQKEPVWKKSTHDVPDVAELKLAGLLPGVGPVKKWGFDFGGYKTALRDNIERELDYRSEASRQARFHDQVRVPGLVIRRVREELTRPTLLVQDWQAVGRVLLSSLLASLFEAGEVHGDPYPGNSY